MANKLLALHPRALIRHAVVRVLKEHPDTAALMADRVFANREEHWLCEELPAAGVYTLLETHMDTGRSPDPDERRLDLIVEALGMSSVALDDRMDSLALAVEMALDFTALGEAMQAIAIAKAPDTLPKGWHASDLLLSLGLIGTELGLAVTGEREIGVAALNFELEYRWPEFPIPLPDFLLGYAGWDVHPADGHLEMESRAQLEPTPKE